MFRFVSRILWMGIWERAGLITREPLLPHNQLCALYFPDTQRLKMPWIPEVLANDKYHYETLQHLFYTPYIQATGHMGSNKHINLRTMFELPLILVNNASRLRIYYIRLKIVYTSTSIYCINNAILYFCQNDISFSSK